MVWPLTEGLKQMPGAGTLGTKQVGHPKKSECRVHACLYGHLSKGAGPGRRKVNTHEANDLVHG